MTKQWKAALIKGVLQECKVAQLHKRVFSNYELLAEARMVLGTDDSWTNTTGKQVQGWLSTANLVAHVDTCSDYCKGATAITLLRANKADKDAISILSRMLQRIRVTGRTAYVSQGHQGHASDMRSNAIFLSATTLVRHGQHGFPSLILQKVANYVSQGSANQRWSYGTADLVWRGQALVDWDKFTNSNNPSIKLKVNSGQQRLLGAEFTAHHNDVAKIGLPWSKLPQHPQPLAFSATGKGEVSIATSMRFVPAQLYSSPVYRGIYVQKIIQAIDSRTGQPTGKPLKAVTRGQVVAVTLQITTADDVRDVLVEDWSAGGLEPMDPLIDHKALSTNSCGGSFRRPQYQTYGFNAQAYYYFYSCVSFERQTRPDRVSYYSRFVRAGTHTMVYSATAATAGSFVLPPAHAWVAMQPEVMGLSGSGHFSIGLGKLTDKERFSDIEGVPQNCPSSCKKDCDVQTGKCNRVSALTTLIHVAKACNIVELSKACRSVDVHSSKSCQSSCAKTVHDMVQQSKCMVSLPSTARLLMQKLVTLCNKDAMSPLFMGSKRGDNGH
eukprot:COSAG05_NODE_1721_length_4213_cov_2.835197_3_plen_553_part_00